MHGRFKAFLLHILLCSFHPFLFSPDCLCHLLLSCFRGLHLFFLIAITSCSPLMILFSSSFSYGKTKPYLLPLFHYLCHCFCFQEMQLHLKVIFLFLAISMYLLKYLISVASVFVVWFLVQAYDGEAYIKVTSFLTVLILVSFGISSLRRPIFILQNSLPALVPSSYLVPCAIIITTSLKFSSSQ